MAVGPLAQFEPDHARKPDLSSLGPRGCARLAASRSRARVAPGSRVPRPRGAVVVLLPDLRRAAATGTAQTACAGPAETDAQFELASRRPSGSPASPRPSRPLPRLAPPVAGSRVDARAVVIEEPRAGGVQSSFCAPKAFAREGALITGRAATRGSLRRAAPAVCSARRRGVRVEASRPRAQFERFVAEVASASVPSDRGAAHRSRPGSCGLHAPLGTVVDCGPDHYARLTAGARLIQLLTAGRPIAKVPALRRGCFSAR